MRDFYGRLRSAQNGNQMDAPMIYEIDASTNNGTTTRYIRFDGSNDKPIAVWKETETKDGDGNVTSFVREFAMTVWADKAGATYAPINNCWEI